jgi:hypothetical protein
MGPRLRHRPELMTDPRARARVSPATADAPDASQRLHHLHHVLLDWASDSTLATDSDCEIENLGHSNSGISWTRECSQRRRLERDTDRYLHQRGARIIRHSSTASTTWPAPTSRFFQTATTSRHSTSRPKCSVARIYRRTMSTPEADDERLTYWRPTSHEGSR